MEQILIFFMKALTALTYILAMLFPFILIGWCFAEWRKLSSLTTPLPTSLCSPK